MRLLDLDIYLPEFRASILELSVKTFGDNPWGRVLSGLLKIESGHRAIESWQVGTTVVYNTCSSRMILHDRWAALSKSNQEWFELVPPGRILCTLDESSPDEDRGPDYETETHADLVRRNVVCLLIAKFGHYRDLEAVETDGKLLATFFALMLEPTGREGHEYRRIGMAEIPEDGLVEGWDERVVTIV